MSCGLCYVLAIPLRPPQLKHLSICVIYAGFLHLSNYGDRRKNLFLFLLCDRILILSFSISFPPFSHDRLLVLLISSHFLAYPGFRCLFPSPVSPILSSRSLCHLHLVNFACPSRHPLLWNLEFLYHSILTVHHQQDLERG